MKKFSLRALPQVLFAALLLAVPQVHAGVPVPENFPGATDLSGPVMPVIPVAKVLILPITAYDPDGNRLSFTATSDNKAVMVRVKTGNPLLKITINHAGDSANGDPAYSGDVVFQLFRDITPQTAGYIAGFAQAGFYNNLTFHRLADLNDPQDPSKPASSKPSYIFQGGDPSGDGTGGPGFVYDNEQDASLIFAGRGQLAMANSSYGSTYHGTNGSQFFITDGKIALNSDNTVNTDLDGRPRALDMGYTIFGQLTHGWDMLDNLRNTPRWPYPPNNADGTAGTAATGETPDTPKNKVSITAATVTDLYQPDSNQPLAYSDASLVLSATAPGTAKITVTISDNQNPPHTVKQTFTVRAAVDTVNTKPFISPLGNHVTTTASNVTGTTSAQFQANVAKQLAAHPELEFPFKVIDLERDYVSIGSQLVTSSSSSSPPGFTGLISQRTLAIIGNAAYSSSSSSTSTSSYSGPLSAYVSATQFSPTYRGTIDAASVPVDNYSPALLTVGDKAITGEPAVITGVAKQALNGAVAASFRNTNTRATSSDITATINWGDGTTQTPTNSTTATANFPATISSGGSPGAGQFQVTGTDTHTYTNPGIYPVTVTLSDTHGLSQQILSTAVITSASSTGSPLVAVGKSLSIRGRNTGSQVLATFTDNGITSSSYSAVIDWGDGVVAPGTVKPMGGNQFKVLGSHTYNDPENFAILIRIHRTADSDTSNDGIAWTRASIIGFTGQQHIPPFDQAHLVAQLSAAPAKRPTATTAASGSKPTKEIVGDIDTGNTQTYLRYSLFVFNNGNKRSKAGTLTLYLAKGTKPSADDIGLGIGHHVSNNSPTPVIIPPLQPGIQSGITYYFDNVGGEFRLVPPPNETCTGYNVLAKLDYSDPIVDNEPVPKFALAGKIDGVDITPTSIHTDEAGKPATFYVRLDKAPGKDANGNDVTATIPVSVGTSSYATVSPSSLTFNNGNWNQYQTVTVTGLPDLSTTNGVTANTASGTHYITVSLGPIVSTGGILDGMVLPSVSATSGDISTNIRASVTTLRTTDPYGNGPTNSFAVTLSQAPTAPVTIQLHAQLPTTTDSTTVAMPEGLLSVNGSIPAQTVVLTFNPADPAHSAVPPILSQTVTVYGLDDGTRSASTNYKISFDPSFSDDPEFDQIEPASITVTNQHASTNPFMLSSSFVTTSDPRGSSNQVPFNVILSSQPTANVTVSLTVNPSANGQIQGTLSGPAVVPDPTKANTYTLTFTPGDALLSDGKTVGQPVTITGLGDGTVNDVANYAITFGTSASTDPRFDKKVPATVFVANQHLPPVIVSATTVTTSDPRGSDNTSSFTATLAVPPPSTTKVMLTARVKPAANGQYEGLLSVNGSTPAQIVTLTFDGSDATTFSQQITVIGQDDGTTSGTTDYEIDFDPLTSTGSGDQTFAGYQLPSISATNQHFP